MKPTQPWPQPDGYESPVVDLSKLDRPASTDMEKELLKLAAFLYGFVDLWQIKKGPSHHDLEKIKFKLDDLGAGDNVTLKTETIN